MATTKYKISEQIQRMLKGNPVISARVHQNDIKLLIEQVANQLLKAETLSVNMADGDSLPPNCMIYTYDNVTVSTYKTTKSKATLPSIPVSLPRNMGVLHVSKTDAIDEPFIPIPASTYGIIKPQALLGDLSGLIGYEVVGKDIIFTQNLPGQSVNNVFIRLVGVDMSSITDYELMPLSSDMEAQIVQTVYNILVQAPPADKALAAND
jgi:hypothetical protein